jgi:hypothetical protein
MKTAMQEAIKEIAELWSSPSDRPNYTQIFKVLEGKLEHERKQHETTFHRGINIGALNPKLDIEGRKEAAKHYYESTFIHLNNQNK